MNLNKTDKDRFMEFYRAIAKNTGASGKDAGDALYKAAQASNKVV